MTIIKTKIQVTFGYTTVYNDAKYYRYSPGSESTILNRSWLFTDVKEIRTIPLTSTSHDMKRSVRILRRFDDDSWSFVISEDIRCVSFAISVSWTRTSCIATWGSIISIATCATSTVLITTMARTTVCVIISARSIICARKGSAPSSI